MWARLGASSPSFRLSNPYKEEKGGKREAKKGGRGGGGKKGEKKDWLKPWESIRRDG